MLEKMTAADYAIPPALGLSAPCVQLLRSMLEPDPSKRIRMDEILSVGGRGRTGGGGGAGCAAFASAPRRRQPAGCPSSFGTRLTTARGSLLPQPPPPRTSLRWLPRTPGSCRGCRPML
jgi:hypothetical protein